MLLQLRVMLRESFSRPHVMKTGVAAVPNVKSPTTQYSPGKAPTVQLLMANTRAVETGAKKIRGIFSCIDLSTILTSLKVALPCNTRPGFHLS